MKIQYLILFMLVFSFGACKKESEAKQALRTEKIELEITTKVRLWKARRNKICRTKAMKQAMFIADSLLLDYARSLKMGVNRPQRPIKPTEPPLLRPSDTLTLAPFIKDTF